MKILVTGGSGRLGRSVVALLAERGHDVHSADRTEVAEPAATQHVLDLANAVETNALIDSVRPEAVVHLAAISAPFLAPEREILLTNTALTTAVVEASVQSGVSRILIASSPTVVGYNSPTGWTPDYLPIDEAHPARPWNGYALSKLVMEEIIACQMRQHGDTVRFGIFRPCYVISAEEWAGQPTQQGHTVVERLADPKLAAVSLFNYVDARDAAEFVDLWLGADDVPNGEAFLVGAPDALALRPVSELWRDSCPSLGSAADALVGDRPVFSSDKAARLLGWRAARTWRVMLPQADLELLASTLDPEGASIAVR